MGVGGSEDDELSHEHGGWPGAHAGYATCTDFMYGQEGMLDADACTVTEGQTAVFSCPG